MKRAGLYHVLNNLLTESGFFRVNHWHLIRCSPGIYWWKSSIGSAVYDFARRNYPRNPGKQGDRSVQAWILKKKTLISKQDKAYN